MLSSAVASYYRALDAGDDDAAAAAFAEDAVYIRPALDPAAGGDGIEVVRGRAAIRDFFMRRSARKQFGENLHHHEFRSVAVEGADCFVEGVGVTDRGPFAVFVAHATLGDDGLITRYIAIFADTSGVSVPD
jgi:ketosteroid isomerase-like protein